MNAQSNPSITHGTIRTTSWASSMAFNFLSINPTTTTIKTANMTPATKPANKVAINSSISIFALPHLFGYLFEVIEEPSSFLRRHNRRVKTPYRPTRLQNSGLAEKLADVINDTVEFWITL